LDRQARGPDRAGPAGADVCAPEPHLPECVAAFNQRPDRPFRLHLAVPADFEAAVRRRGPERPVVTGELNPIFQGAYSSRIGLKQRLRSVETLLTTAEKQGAVLGCLGVETSAASVWDAWEPALFNQAHDLMSGVMTDHVYADTISGYEYSHRVAAAQVEARMEALGAQIDTRGPGVPLLVYNALGWERSDVVVADVGFGGGGDTGLALEDPEGRPVPVQILEAQRHADGSLLQARIAFVAAAVPAVGHAVYRVLPQPADAAARPDAAVWPAAAGLPDPGAAAPPVGGIRWANEHYRVGIDFSTGALMSLGLGADGPELLAGPANVIAVEEDRGDLWELYRPLDAGSRIAMREPHPAPGPGSARLSTQLQQASATWRRGPVLSEFELAPGDLGATRFATRIRVYAGLPRIDIRTTLVNNERFVRYRALFPTAVQGGAAVHEIPFGAVERPDGVEFPAQNWIDYGDGRHGLALLNRGVPGNNVAGGTMMLSLLRAASIVAYGYGGGYEPGMSSESGHELGQEHTFEYSLVPHAGDWRAAGLWRHGLELNNPLLVRPVGVHAGPLPARWGWLRVSAPTVVVSALKPGEAGGVVLRLYEAAGRAATGVSVQLAAPVAAAAEADLLEAPGAACPVVGNGLRLDFRPFQIRTIRLEMGPWTTSP
jgi:alpha-mannosidase